MNNPHKGQISSFAAFAATNHSTSIRIQLATQQKGEVLLTDTKLT
jgi:hypothetical protein